MTIDELLQSYPRYDSMCSHDQQLVRDVVQGLWDSYYHGELREFAAQANEGQIFANSDRVILEAAVNIVFRKDIP